MLNRIITIYSISYIVGTILFPLLAEALLNASMLAPYVIAMIVLWLGLPCCCNYLYAAKAKNSLQQCAACSSCFTMAYGQPFCCSDFARKLVRR